MKKFFAFLLGIGFCHCSFAQNVEKALQALINDPAVRGGHIGVAVYDADSAKYIAQHNADRYFTPASNTKLMSMYFALKYLRDSVPAFTYEMRHDTLHIYPGGDPMLLHPEYADQRSFDFLKANGRVLVMHSGYFTTTSYGSGWSWGDYDESYMNERSEWPVFGNNMVFTGIKAELNYYPKSAAVIKGRPGNGSNLSRVRRDFHSNTYMPLFGENAAGKVVIPFITSDSLAAKILADTLHKEVILQRDSVKKVSGKIFYARHLDSLLTPLMHESDNFFAEQSLLMVSHKLTGEFNTEKVIKKLLDTDLKGMPNEPSWADGCGLSRYNLFTPFDFIWLLNQMRKENNFSRVQAILPTGGTGTLKAYYKDIPGKIFAKTGTLSHVVGLSGYIQKADGRWLTFSILANNFPGGPSPVRRAIETFLKKIRTAD